MKNRKDYFKDLEHSFQLLRNVLAEEHGLFLDGEKDLDLLAQKRLERETLVRDIEALVYCLIDLGEDFCLKYKERRLLKADLYSYKDIRLVS